MTKMEGSKTSLVSTSSDHMPYLDVKRRPHSCNSVLGLASPDPCLVKSARIAIAKIEADLALRLAFLPSLVDTNDTLELSSSLGNNQESILLQEATLQHEAEIAKQPHKAIIALSELHQIYDQLIEERQHFDEISNLHRLTSSQSNHSIDNHGIKVKDKEAYNNIHDSFQGVVEFILRQASQEKRTGLDLSGRLLGHNHIEKSFGHLSFSALIFLDLSRNRLKELPEETIKQLYNLETLDLQSNELEKLPPTISSLSKLRTLNLSSNMLKSLHDNLGACRSLRELIVAFNQLESLPLNMGYDLTSLRILSLHSNKLSFLSPSICNLVHLKVLDLHFNKLQYLPLEIGGLKSLEKLNLSNNFSDFGGELPRSLGDLTCLINLDLSYNQVRVLPDSIGALSKLRVLKIDNNPLVVPPKKVVEHSMEAMLEYIKERWIVSQSSGHEISTSFSITHFEQSKSSHVRTSTSWFTSLVTNSSCKSMKCATPVSSIIRVDRRHKTSKIHES